MKMSLDPKRLFARREQLGLTQAEAAGLIRISQPAYQRYEAGTRSPSAQMIDAIAAALHTSAAYLCGESDHAEPDCIQITKADTPALFDLIERCKDFDEAQLQRLLFYMKELDR